MLPNTLRGTGLTPVVSSVWSLAPCSSDSARWYLPGSPRSGCVYSPQLSLVYLHAGLFSSMSINRKGFTPLGGSWSSRTWPTQQEKWKGGHFHPDCHRLLSASCAHKPLEALVGSPPKIPLAEVLPAWRGSSGGAPRSGEEGPSSPQVANGTAVCSSLYSLSVWDGQAALLMHKPFVF